MQRILIAAATLLALAAPANAGQMLVPGPGGLRYSRPFPTQQPAGYGQGYYNYAPRGYVQPGYLRGYFQPNPGAMIAGAVLGAMGAAAQPRPAYPVAAPPTAAYAPPSNALAEVDQNDRGITRQEVEAAIADWCASHGDAPLCVKFRLP